MLLVADPYPRLFHNERGERFQDVTDDVGLATLEGDWTGCAIGDYNADGTPDILLTGIRFLALLENQAGHRFHNATSSAGLDPHNHELWGSSAGFMDLDGDQLLDLVILNYVTFNAESKQYCEYGSGILAGCPPAQYRAERGEIWRNTGNGRFTLLPLSAGMASTHGIGLVVAFTDLDGDGRMDFYLGNDGVDADLMHNQGNLTFKNIGHLSGVATTSDFVSMAAMGADFGDYDRDGLLDLTVTNFQDLRFAIFRNQGEMFFSDVGVTTRVAARTKDRLGFGAKWLDMDNDGWLDICFVNGHVYDNVAAFEPHHQFRQSINLLRNQEGKQFTDVVAAMPSDVSRKLVGRGSATGDFNNDGHVDLLIVDFEGPVMLLDNRTENETIGSRWIYEAKHRITLPTAPKWIARSGQEVWVQEVSPASSYLSSSDPRIHFGLGLHSKLDTVAIRWSDGTELVLRDVPADQILRVNQFQMTPE